MTSSSETPDEVVRWFNRSHLRLHPYTLEGPWVTIPTENWEGKTTNWRGETLDWQGEIEGDVLRMTRRWSFTTDMATYVFVPIHGEPGPPPPLKVTEPNPPDGAKAVRVPLLRWQFSRTAASYDVYLGTNPELGSGNRVASHHSLALFYYPPGLISGTTYYWRVDVIEASGTILTGDVWSFTAE